MNYGPYTDSNGVRWVSRYRKCANCRCDFERWGPNSGHLSKDGLRSGMSYCPPCSRSISLRNKSKVVGTKTCRKCGKPFPVTAGADYAKQYGHGSVNYCSRVCYEEFTRKYANRQEKNRQKKRRQRARRRIEMQAINGQRRPLRPGT